MGLRLLLTLGPDAAAAIAQTLDEVNRQRQVVEAAIMGEAMAQAQGAGGCRACGDFAGAVRGGTLAW